MRPVKPSSVLLGGLRWWVLVSDNDLEGVTILFAALYILLQK